MANARGPVFVSYRRRRLEETDALVQALHDRGLPTWRDVDDLAPAPTEATIRSVLNDDNTSGAVLWLTPDVEQSPIIRDVEVPEAVRRYRRDSAFWLVVVLADGLDYADVSALFRNTLGVEDLASWNLTKVASPWASREDVIGVAVSALRQRVTRLSSEGSTSAVEVSVHAKGTPPAVYDDVLVVNWARYFRGGAPKRSDWDAMSEAARDMATAVKQLSSPGTSIQYSGTPSIPAATLLGSTYSARDGRLPSYLQRQPDGITLTPWTASDFADASLAEQCGWRVEPLVYGETSAHALAVCVNISEDVSEGFARSRAAAPAWRAVLQIGSPTRRNTRARPLTSEEAASLVHLTIDAVREARFQIRGIDSVHLFIAAPAGYAFMLGTSIATFPTVTTYEYNTASRLYAAAAILNS